MFGDDALKLIIDARRSTATDTLQKYNSELVRTVCLETRLLSEEIKRLSESLPANDDDDDGDVNVTLAQNRPVLCNLAVQHLCTFRNKRCLLAYHAHRLDHLSSLFWLTGSPAPLLNDADARSRLAPLEVDFLRAYNDLVLDYKGPFIDVLDLGASIERPPKELYVTVRVVRDCGTIRTERGEIDFRKGQRFLVRRSDVEGLIVQGYLEEVM